MDRPPVPFGHVRWVDAARELAPVLDQDFGIGEQQAVGDVDDVQQLRRPDLQIALTGEIS